MHLTILRIFFRKNYANLHIHFISLFLSERIFNPREYVICWLNSLCYSSFVKSIQNRNPFFCCFRKVYISTIKRKCRGFRSDILNGTFTSPGATPFFNCLLIRSVYHLLNLWGMNFFAFWFIEIPRCWISLLKLGGTITNSQSFFKHNALISALSWPLKVSITINECCSFWVTKLFAHGFKVVKIDFSNNLTYF